MRGPCRPEHAGVPGLFRNGSSDYERIGDHATNVAEIILAMHGEKTGAEVPGSY
ncbi:MAG: hypothetical protein IJ822_01090 [Pyramidobacter sp.]|nr:hypothetical protein [Pyramidobacter sp.]